MIAAKLIGGSHYKDVIEGKSINRIPKSSFVEARPDRASDNNLFGHKQASRAKTCEANGAEDGRLMGTVEEVTHPINIKMKGVFLCMTAYILMQKSYVRDSRAHWRCYDKSICMAFKTRDDAIAEMNNLHEHATENPEFYDVRFENNVRMTYLSYKWIDVKDNKEHKYAVEIIPVELH